MVWNLLAFVIRVRIVINSLRLESHGVICCALVRNRDLCILTRSLGERAAQVRRGDQRRLTCTLLAFTLPLLLGHQVWRKRSVA